MSVKRLMAGIILGALCTALAYGAVSAEDTTPGGAGDPLVTKSYVDKRVDEVMRVLGSSEGVSPSVGTDELMAQIEYAVQQQLSGVQAQESQGAVFAPVQIEMGQTIFGGEGTEMILRTGSGHIVTSTDTVVNATSGVDLKNGASVPKGNLLIFPRNDGRGVKAADSCWFLVKGAYTVS